LTFGSKLSMQRDQVIGALPAGDASAFASTSFGG
jgi:hypothetical protein